MERLTWRDKTGQALYKMDNPQMGLGKCERRVLDRLAELEDELENGTLIKLPCKVGDTVYEIASEYESYYGRQYVEETKFSLELLEQWGKSVFATREEAEKRLEELRG